MMAPFLFSLHLVTVDPTLQRPIKRNGVTHMGLHVLRMGMGRMLVPAFKSLASDSPRE